MRVALLMPLVEPDNRASIRVAEKAGPGSCGSAPERVVLSGVRTGCPWLRCRTPTGAGVRLPPQQLRLPRLRRVASSRTAAGVGCTTPVVAI